MAADRHRSMPSVWIWMKIRELVTGSMPLFFKTLDGIIFLSIGPYIYCIATVYLSLSWMKASYRVSTWRPASILSIVLLHGIPLFVSFSGWLNNTLLQTPSGDESEFLTFLFGGAALVAAQSGVYLLPVHVLSFLYGKVRPDRTGGRRIATAWISISILIAMSFYVPLRMQYDKANVVIERTDWSVKSLPRSLNGFRVAVLGDTQLGEWTSRELMHNYIHAVNAERPDMILFTGDLLTSPKDSARLATAASLMGELQAPYGVYAAIGDHDHWYGRSDVIEALRANGIAAFTDTTRVQRTGALTMGLTFLVNVFDERASERTLDSLLAAGRSAQLRVLVTHIAEEPVVRVAEAHDAHLVVAGHTHGGQIGLNLLWMRFTSSMLDSRYVSGFYEEGNTLVYVNSGLGMSVIPIRYNSTPSIGIITLRAPH